VSLRDAGRRWVRTATGRPELAALTVMERRADELASGVREEVALRPLTGQDLDALVGDVAEVAARVLEKRRREA
jgi:hypothetical protein